MAQTKETKTTEKKVRTQIGKVVKVSDPRTVKVRVERKQPHPLYHKIVASHKNYLVDCTTEQAEQVQSGQIVEIAEMKSVSKRKAWKLVQVVTQSKA